MFSLDGEVFGPTDIDKVLGTGQIYDDVIRLFHDVLANNTPFQPRPIDYLYFTSENFPSVAKGVEHLQVIYREPLVAGTLNGGHWVALYYDGAVVNIYDSMAYNNLSPLQVKFLEGLFPYRPPVVYKPVQRQTDSINCGLFATAFTTSIALKRDPCKEQYIVSSMRLHLATMLKRRQLSPFPIQLQTPALNKPSCSFSCSGTQQKYQPPDIKENSSCSSEWTLVSRKRVNKSRDETNLKKEKEREKKRRRRAKALDGKTSPLVRIPPTPPCSSPIVKGRYTLHSTSLTSLIQSQPQQPADVNAASLDEIGIQLSLPNVLSSLTVKRGRPSKKKSQFSRVTKKQQRDRERQLSLRKNEEYRDKLKNGERLNKANLRRSQTSSQQSKARLQDRNNKQSKRLDNDYRVSEQLKNTQAHREARTNPEYRESEQLRDSQARREARRNDPDYNELEANQRRLRDESNKTNWAKITEKFSKSISEGYSHACCCCGRLFHKKSIVTLTKAGLMSVRRPFPENFLTDVFHLHPEAETGEFCRTCTVYIRKGIIPKLARCNGLVFPPIPNVIKELNALEERLVSPRHVFLKIVRKGHGLGFQHGLVGNVVNVPVELDTMVSALPRCITDDHVITVELKRKMCYLHGRKERVRPEKVRQAANYLVNTGLFQDLGITLNDSWSLQDNVNETSECTCIGNPVDNGTVEDEENEPLLNPGNQETLLDTDTDITLVMAPGEGKRPLSLIFDDHLEELAFINVHCGERRQFKTKMSHLDVIKSEISRNDRRAVRPDYLFTALKKEQMICIKNNITTCLRKKSPGGSRILVENLLDDDFLNNLVQHDEGYRVLKSIRNSPAHWESEKKKVLSMIRQFGVPTFFTTLSAAETKWPHLIKLLKQVVDNECITLEEVDSLSYSDKARLIQSDPFVCATYFEIRLQELRKTWGHSVGPFGEHRISNFYYRIEFQHRGSPHAHLMLWLEGAPFFKPGNTDSMIAVSEFVDSIISCNSDDLDSSLLALQKHKHTHTCHPKPGRPCRFDIPFFPMDHTKILIELDSAEPSYKEAKVWGENIKNALQSMPQNIETFAEFLKFLHLSYSQYILGIRSTIKKPKLFLKRHPKDVMINPFCKKIIDLHQANMDIQYILDPFACAQYVVNYINKADRGISRLLRSAVEEVKKGNKGVKESLRSISNVFLNASEISAQEAVYCLIGLPMSRTSQTEIFINTSPPEQRVHILRSKKELAKMDPLSSDIFLPNLLDHYFSRPNNEEFNNMSLAEFAAYYTYSKKSQCRTLNSDEDVEDTDSSAQASSSKWIALQHCSGWIRRRSKPKIVRYRNYNIQQDPDNFFREQLMLYVPWRSEQDELINPSLDLEQKFKDFSESIRRVSSEFNRLGVEAFDNLIANIRQVEAGENNEENNECTPNRIYQPLKGFEFEVQLGDVIDDIIPGGNPGPDLVGDSRVMIARPSPVTECDLLAMTRKLNREQRSVLLHVVHHFQITSLSSQPIYLFVSGGAGVGKSLFIKTLYQCLLAYFNSEPGSNPDDLKILLSAPTGKAAFGIGGQTIHSALGLPISQAGNVIPELAPSVANTLACKLANLRLIVIDEISMVGTRTFHQINRRLQQLFHSNVLFAGISLIVVGDLRQLPPVGDNWVFQPNSSNSLALLAGAPLWELFKLFEFKKIMRQRDDFTFASALNNMAIGAMTDQDIALFRKRTFSSSTLPAEAEGAVHLFASNKEVDAYNDKILSNMTTEVAVSDAIDTVSGTSDTNCINKALKTVSSLPTTHTYGLPKSIKLRVGARYVMTVNEDTSDGLVNGSTGRLRKIDYGVNKSTGERRPLRLWLELDERSAGRNKMQSVSRVEISRLGTDRWTPVECVTYTVKRWKSSNLQVRRTQFPLVTAEAITIHKSQGATLEKVVVHFKPPNKRSLMYVACSRATTASGLFIVADKGFNPPTPPASTNPVLLEMQKLRETPLIPMFDFLSNQSTGMTQVFFHNVQSLRKHEEDVAVDPVVRASEVVLLVETWSCPQDEFNRIKDIGFVEVCRTNGPRLTSANPGRGALALVKSELAADGRVHLSPHQSMSHEYATGHCEAVWITVNTEYVLVALYKSPKCQSSSLLHFLRAILDILGQPTPPLILVGDLNTNLTTQNPIVEYLYSQNLRSVLPLTETTRGHKTIDGVFASVPCECGVYESFFSYHRPLWIRF